jgi:hypothetical protein
MILNPATAVNRSLDTRAHRPWTPVLRYRVLCAAVLLWGCFQGHQGGLLPQLNWSWHPSTQGLMTGFYAGIDPAYLLLHGSGLFGLLIQPTAARLFTYCLGLALLAQVLRPNKGLAWSLAIALPAYGLCLNAALGFPAHSTYPALLLMPFGLWALGPHGRLAEDGFRYVAAFPLASAAVYKVLQGGPAEAGSMVELLQWQHAGLLLESGWPLAEGSGWRHRASLSAIRWAIAHPSLARIGYLSAFALQASFLLAFFTKRLDAWFPWLLLLFVLQLGLFMRLDFSSLLILAVFFIRTGQHPSTAGQAEAAS